jgi:hypothetical protein
MLSKVSCCTGYRSHTVPRTVKISAPHLSMRAIQIPTSIPGPSIQKCTVRRAQKNAQNLEQGPTPGRCIIPTVSTHSWPSPSGSEEGLLIGTREKCSQESTLKNENEGVIGKDSVPELKEKDKVIRHLPQKGAIQKKGIWRITKNGEKI